MKKNIAIAVLSLLCIGFFFYGLIQKIEAEKQAKMTLEQAKVAQECAQQAEQQMKIAQMEAQRAFKLFEEAQLRAEKAQKERQRR